MCFIENLLNSLLGIGKPTFEFRPQAISHRTQCHSPSPSQMENSKIRNIRKNMTWRSQD